MNPLPYKYWKTGMVTHDDHSDLFSPLDPDQRILSDEVISYLSRNYQTMYQKYMTLR